MTEERLVRRLEEAINTVVASIMPMNSLAFSMSQMSYEYHTAGSVTWLELYGYTDATLKTGVYDIAVEVMRSVCTMNQVIFIDSTDNDSD